MKKTLAILFAALLVLSMAACGGDNTPAETTADTSLVLPQGTGEATTLEAVTDAEGNIVPGGEQETVAPDNISEQNPTFKNVNLTLYVWANANVRSSTVLGSDDNVVGWVTKGQDLTATGESDNWYRVTIKDKDDKDITAYVAKTIAGDKAILDTFTEVDNEEITLTGNCNVRSFPNANGGSYNRVGGLKEGDKVTRVAVSAEWSCILFEVVSETETDAEGNAVKSYERCYITNQVIDDAADTTAETAAATEEVKA